MTEENKQPEAESKQKEWKELTADEKIETILLKIAVLEQRIKITEEAFQIFVARIKMRGFR